MNIPEPILLTCDDPELWDCHVEKDKVALRIDKLNPTEDSYWRVSVWGNDDFAMIRDFDNHEAATKMFERLSDYSIPVTISELAGIGFRRYY